MTDLLMRLAERTLGTTPTARPVIASMFESVPSPGPFLSTSQPAFSDMEETVEAGAPAQPTHVPYAPTSMPAASGMDQQPSIRPMSTAAGATSEATSTRTRIAPRQSENAGAPGIETRQDDVVSLPREQIRHPAKETISPAPEELRQAKLTPAVPIVPGRPAEAFTPTPYVQREAGTLPGIAQLIDQKFPLEIDERPETRSPLEQRRAGETYSTAHQQEQSQRGAEPTSFLVQMPGQEVTPAQSMIHEVRALEAASTLPSQQQGNHSIDGSIAQETGHTRRFNESGTSQSDQLTLVPTRRATQIIEQAPANQKLERGIESHSPSQAFSHQNGQVGPRIVEKAVTGTGEAQVEAPTIHVTIGRIDVRAVTSATPSARPKPTRAGPAVSLEEYTRQNKGGR